MFVTKEQLISYNIPQDFWFSRANGYSDPSDPSRDEYFINNPEKLQAGIYCAVGNDTNGWELQQFDGENWKIIEPDESYKLVITSEGLRAVTNTIIGGYKIVISGVKILDDVITNPSTPFVNWDDNLFTRYGNVTFSIGTLGAHYPADDGDGSYSYLKQILSWRYNNASGGLQYCLDLPPEGIGSQSNDEEDEWKVGTIGLYVKGTDGASDVLFAIATLPSVVIKYANQIKSLGNRLKFYFNTVLNNFGFISNLEVMEDGNRSLPEVPNETLLVYPQDNKTLPYNCYLIDNLYGSNIPALAVPRPLNNSTSDNISNDWVYFQPSNNFIYTTEDTFDINVQNYQFVYWNTNEQKYKLAQGRFPNDLISPNIEMPIGLRVGNNIVYSGEITNLQNMYQYIVNIYNGGSGYAIYDELDIVIADNLIIKIRVTNVNSDNGGEITDFEIMSPYGNTGVEGGEYLVQSAVYDKASQLPRNGTGARFKITSRPMDRKIWEFTAQQLNKPVYCGRDENAGNPVFEPTDCFIGWVTGANSIRLALDLRNEATDTNYGTTRYANTNEIKEVVSCPTPANKTAVTPQGLYENYIQKTKSTNSTQAGSNWSHPIEVNTCIHFNETIVGKSVTDFSSLSSNAHWNNGNTNVDFWGKAYRAEWADLAEYYESDEIYLPGTLITFGQGDKEITKAQFEADGVISTKPGLQLGLKKNDHYLPVALAGRVPVMMDGNSINYFGDKIYLSRIKPGTASTIKNGKCIGKIVDKNPGTKRLVECIVRIEFTNE